MKAREDEAERPVLDVSGLSVTLRQSGRDVDIVRDIDLTVRPGEFVALLGESGSGKSVTTRAVMGLLGDGAGVRAARMSFGGIDLLTVDEESRRKIRGDGMSLVLQDALSSLNPVLTIGDQIVDLIRSHRKVTRRQARARAAELLSMVGIPSPAERIDAYPHEFSGGMRQRILMAMAIALEPELLIADEPTTALDVTVQAQVLELLDRLRRELGMAVLLITHDLGVVMEVADRLAVMYAGRIVEAGEADVILTRPSHPYTASLLRAVPQLADRGSELYAIPGSPPNPALLPHGCAFHPRCPMAQERCRETDPEYVDLDEQRAVACLRAEEVLDVSR